MVVFFVIGRIIVGLYFLFGAYNHWAHLKTMGEYAGSKGVPAPGFASAFTGLMLFLGGLSILFGVFTIIGIIILEVFLLGVSFKMHNFWTYQDPQQRMAQQVNFTKNMALFGFLLMLLYISHWPVSL